MAILSGMAELTQDEMAKRLREHLDRHLSGEMACPLCKNTRWAPSGPTSPSVVRLHTERGEPSEVTSQGIPMIHLTCMTCGLMHSLSALFVFRGPDG